MKHEIKNIEPAPLVFNLAGIPASERYGDIYHSSSGGVAQAKHVFLAGNGLPESWRGKNRFVILETGFGLGINFLTTWQTWLADPLRCDELCFISVEKHPFCAQDMVLVLGNMPELRKEGEIMLQHWPSLEYGVHCIELSQGRVHLHLHWGDACETLPGLDTTVDAFYLDGFSPAVNPDMWSKRLCTCLSALSHDGTTLATWSVAGSVRRALSQAGFIVAKCAGFAEKKQMLTGSFPGKSAN